MTKSSKIATEYLRFLEINDPIEALDECRSAFRQAKRGHWRRIRTLLGMIATMHARVSRDPRRWKRFINRKFWKNCSGERPTMADQFDGLRFAVWYAERPHSRLARQNASKHTIAIGHLLERGLKPGQIPLHLSKRGQGINATCAASAQSSSSPASSPKTQSSGTKGSTPQKVVTTSGTQALALEGTPALIKRAKGTPAGHVQIVANHLKNTSGGDRFVMVSIKAVVTSAKAPRKARQ